MTTFCTKCDCECIPLSVDQGGYEECWGAPVWVPAWEYTSDCCNADVYEEDEEE
jgi:hypothetical protein